jgi:hypothetical protein
MNIPNNMTFNARAPGAVRFQAKMKTINVAMAESAKTME